MIKHGKIRKMIKSTAKTHLKDVMHLITRGIADAKENVTLHPQRCDVKGAKRHSVLACVLARTLLRVYKPQAAVVGRSLAYVIDDDGLATRFKMSRPATRVAEEFDTRGRAHLAPVKLLAVQRSWRLGTPQRGKNTRVTTGKKLKRAKRYGARAVGGGVVK